MRSLRCETRTVHVRRRLVPACIAALALVLSGCGLLDRLACMGDPVRLSAELEPETLVVEAGASGSVDVTVYGLSERCYPQATGVGFAETPEGISSEPIGVTAEENTGTLEVVVAESVEPGTYPLQLRLSAYAHQPATVTLEVPEASAS